MMLSIEMRRSIRKYRPQPVEDDKIAQLLESARMAPSGSNTQPCHFIIVRSDATRRKLSEASHRQDWMNAAPVFIVCVADIRCRIEPGAAITLDENSPGPELKQIIRDTSIAVEHMVLQAVELGLGTCWVAWFDQTEIRPLLNIPSDKYVVAILTVGYPAETPSPRPRKALTEMIHQEIW